MSKIVATNVVPMDRLTLTNCNATHCGRAEGPISENINVHQKCRVVAHFVGKTALIMVPINFWRNSDPFKKKEHFSSSKTDRIRLVLRKSMKTQS